MGQSRESHVARFRELILQEKQASGAVVRLCLQGGVTGGDQASGALSPNKKCFLYARALCCAIISCDSIQRCFGFPEHLYRPRFVRYLGDHRMRTSRDFEKAESRWRPKSELLISVLSIESVSESPGNQAGIRSYCNIAGRAKVGCVHRLVSEEALGCRDPARS